MAIRFTDMLVACKFAVSRAGLLLVLAILSTGCERDRSPLAAGSNAGDISPAKESGAAAAEGARAQGLPLENVSGRLKDAGWPEGAAKKVADLNSDWFKLLRENDPPELTRELKALERLGRHATVFDVLESHPETALLLAGAKDPRGLADSCRNADRYLSIAGLYLRYPAPADAAELGSVLNEGRHAQVICDLARQGVLGAETAYLQGVIGDAGSREYGEWLDEVLITALGAGDVELCSTWTFVLAQGPWIRRALIDEAGFRDEFRSALWPQFVRLADGKSFTLESFMWEPDIWQVLRTDSGSRLIERWGLLPVSMLAGDDAYPQKIRPTVAQVLLEGDNSKVQALWKFRREPLFHNLLRREGLSAATLRAVCDKLLAAGPDYPSRLSYLCSLSDGSLAEEVGPPVSGAVTWIPLYYTIYEVPKKLLQGRDVPGMEWALAIADPALMLMGPLGPKDLAKAGMSSVAKRAAGSEGTALVTKLNGNAFVRAVGSVAEKQAAKTAPSKFTPWLISEGVAQLKQAIAKQLEQRATFEITGIARTAFKASHVGRESFKRITDLEARLFMRPDARVFLRLDQVVGSNRLIARFLADTAVNGGCDITLNSDPGARAISETGRQVSNAGRAAELAWQKHVSAWWGFNAKPDIALTASAEKP